MISLIGVAVATLLFALAYAVPAAGEPVRTGPRAFRGRVKSIGADGATIMVTHEQIKGWMPLKTSVFSVSNPDVISRLRAGSMIAAIVYDGDYNTLHDVRVTAALASAVVSSSSSSRAA